jgi:predicted nucleic acid-binding protein
MIIVDSNYLFGIRDVEDSLHERAILVGEKLKTYAICYLEDVLKEVQTIISVRKGHKIGFDWIDSIYENESDLDRQYSLLPHEFFEILNLWRELKNNKLSFVDAEIIYISKKYKFPVLTFDDEIKKLLPKELVFG